MSDSSRRKLLKSIAAGSGAIVAGKSLPDSWSRPVVDSVMLPAHAQTSNNGPFAGTAETQGTALDSLISQAHAGENFPPYVCVEPNGALTHATVKLLIDRGVPELYTFVDVPLDGENCSYARSYPCQGVDAGELLRDFGLINDAHADDPNEVCCDLYSVTGAGAGRIVFIDRVVNFSVGPNSCNMPDVCGCEPFCQDN